MNEPVDGFCFFCFTLALEADGYIIRSLGGEVALFARTTDGLDRAVRKYAKAVESGSEIADVTYHEGARVKRIEIAGRDVSEYTIYCEDESYILSAAQTFASRIKQACGAKLAVSTDAPAVPYIELRYVRDEALGNVGHRRIVTADGVTIECSDKYKPQSASFAVLRFLERNLDWIGLFFGKEDLAPPTSCRSPPGRASRRPRTSSGSIPAPGRGRNTNRSRSVCSGSITATRRRICGSSSTRSHASRNTDRAITAGVR